MEKDNDKIPRLVALAAIVATFLLFAITMFVRQPGTCVAGDVRLRQAGQIPATLNEIYFDASRIQFGLGTLAIGEWKSLGDGLVVGGNAWLRTTHQDSPHYYSLISNRFFQTTALAYVLPGVKPARTRTLSGATNLGELWQQLAEDYPDGVMVEGYVLASSLHMIAIAHPPIDGRRLPGSTPYYYTQPMEFSRDTWIYLVGIAAHLSQASWWRDDEMLVRLAPESSGQADGYAHALRLSSAPAETNQAPDPARVAAVGQLVAESQLVKGSLRLYPVQRPGECPRSMASKQP